jgi:hypothetical protein
VNNILTKDVPKMSDHARALNESLVLTLSPRLFGVTVVSVGLAGSSVAGITVFVFVIVVVKPSAETTVVA